MIFLQIIQKIFDFTSTFLICSTIIAALWYIQTLYTKRRFYRMLKDVSGPIALPVIGHLYLVFGSMKQLFIRLCKICDNHPSPIKLWVGTEVNLLITKPEHMQIILNNPNTLEKHTYYKFLKLDNGLVAQPASLWKHDRRIINPAFNTKILEAFIDTYEEKSKKLLLNLEQYVGKGTFDVNYCISEYVMDVLCATSLGVNLNKQDDNLRKLVKTLHRYEEIIMSRILNRHYWINFIYKFSKLCQEEEQCLSDMNQFVEEIIKNRKQMHTEQTELSKHQQNIETEDEYTNIPKRRILIDLLMQSEDEKKLSNEQLRDQMIMFLIAGTDTTSIVTSFILMMLGMHPEIQEKVYEEINNIFIDPNEVVTSQQLSDMHYTEMVIKETMRIFPPLGYIGRKTTKSILLDDYLLPEDLDLILSILNMHRNPDLWPNCMEFDPERFTPENCAQRHPYSFIPFSSGPRNCIGYKLAMLSMKTLLVLIIKKFKIKCQYKKPSDISLRVDMITRPCRGHLISIDYRNKINEKVVL